MAIECCADSIVELRLCDVNRALNTASANGSYLETVEYISTHCRDLIKAIAEHKAEA